MWRRLASIDTTPDTTVAINSRMSAHSGITFPLRLNAGLRAGGPVLGVWVCWTTVPNDLVRNRAVGGARAV